MTSGSFLWHCCTLNSWQASKKWSKYFRSLAVHTIFSCMGGRWINWSEFFQSAILPWPDNNNNKIKSSAALGTVSLPRLVVCVFTASARMSICKYPRLLKRAVSYSSFVVSLRNILPYFRETRKYNAENQCLKLPTQSISHKYEWVRSCQFVQEKLWAM